MPKISVIVPVYKAEGFLQRCVDSVLGQTYQNFEIILVDDGSPDNCGEICDIYAAKDPRIHVIHQQNAGVSAARNAGIEFALKNSDSQWIAFVDSDDWLHKECLHILLKMAQEKSVKMAICDMLWTKDFCMDQTLHTMSVYIMEAEAAFVQFYGTTVTVCCKLIHRSVLKSIRFPLKMRYEDAAVCHRILFDAGTVAVCPEKLYYYYWNEDSFTRSAWTESRLQAVTVHRNRLDYLKEKGYKKAYCRELEEYAERITSNLCSLTDLLKEGPQYRLWFDDMREKLRLTVQEAEEIGAFRLDRERLMTYVYASKSEALWRMARGLQRFWRQVLNR